MHQSVYDRILGILCSVLDAYSAVLFMPGQNASSPRDGYGVNSAFSLGNNLDYTANIMEGQGLVGWILRNKEPLLVSNFDQHNSHLGYYHSGEEETIKAFMGCALRDGLGALCVDSKRQYSFSEKDQKMLYLFAELISSLQKEIQQADQRGLVLKYYSALRTVYALRHHHSRWADFLKHFITLMAETTGFSYCVFCTRDSHGKNYEVAGENIPIFLGDKDELVSYPMSHGLVGWVFREGVPLISDVTEGVPDAPLVGSNRNTPSYHSVAAFPLIIQRKTRGVLCLAHDAPVRIRPETEDFLRMAAEHLALFLENLYVKCKFRDLHHSLKSD